MRLQIVLNVNKLKLSQNKPHYDETIIQHMRQIFMKHFNRDKLHSCNMCISVNSTKPRTQVLITEITLRSLDTTST